MPFSCAASSAPAICFAISSVSATDRACSRAGEPLGERVAFDELEHERAHVHRLLDAVDGADVGMIEGGQQPRFPCEAREAVRIGRERSRHDLDGDVAPQSVVVGAVHLAHAAGAQPPRDPVGTELAIEEAAG